MANGTQFSIDIGANLVTDNVAKQIQALNAKIVSSTNTKIKIPIGIDEKGVKQFENGIKQINTYKDSYGNLYKQVLKFREEIDKVTQQGTGKFTLMSDPDDSLTKVSSKIRTLSTEVNKWTDTQGNINTWTTSVDSAGRAITTRVKESVDGLGNLITETSKWGQKTVEVNGQIKSVYGQIGDTIKTTKEIIEEMTTSTTTQIGQIDDLGKSYQGLITTTEKVGSNGEYLRTVVSKYTDDLGRVIEKTEQFNKANQKVATTMRKIGDIPKIQDTGKTTLINKDGTKTVTEYANGIATLRTVTSQYTTALGALVTETKVYDEQTHKLIKSHREEVNNQKQVLDNIEKENRLKQQLTTTTRENYEVIQREGESYKAVVKTIQEETHEYGTLTTTIITYKNALGETVVETQKVDSEGKHVAQSTKTVNKELNNTANSANKASSGMNNLSKSADKANYGVKNLGWTLSDAFSRLANFYLASLPIRAIQTAISETIKTITDFDSALIEFRKVSDLAGESLSNYVDKLAEMGEVTGSTMQAMVEASTEFRKSGFSDEDSAKLASIAEMYRNIADEEISAADSASFIIAQMKAFNIEADQAESIINGVNEVANNFSVSSADLAKNLGNMSAIMAINNVSMQEQIGMLTGVTEITRNASSASRGLVMISSRLTQVLDDTSSTGKKLTAIYDKLGIELKDENGQLRSHYDILGDLAEQWDSLSENEQKYIALTSAGARQQQNFVSLMENWGQVAKATTTAYNSLGSAQKENEKVMDSVAKKVEILKSQFQQLVIGDGGLQSFAKTILDIGIALLKFANSNIGKAIIAFALLETAILSARKALLTWGQTNVVVSAITSLIAGEATLTQVTNYLTAAIIKNTKAFVTSPLFLGSLALAGVVALGYAMKSYAEQLETATENLRELADQAESTNSELSETKTQLEQIHEQIEKNNKEKLKITNKADLSALNKENDKLLEQEKTLKRQVELLELKLELENQAAEKAAKETYETKGASNIDRPSLWESFKTMAMNPYGVESRVEATTTMVTPAEEMDLAIQKIQDLTAQKEALFKKSLEELKINGELTDTYKQQQKELADLDEQINDAQQAGQKAEDTLETILGSLKSNSKETVELRDKINSQLGSWLDVNKEVNQTVDAYNRLKELSKGGAVDLTIRPIVDDKEMVKAGWGELTDSGSYSTTYTSTFTDKALTKAVNFTPILTDENGNFKGILSPAELQKYAEDVLNGVHGDFKHLQVGVEVNAEEFNGSIDKAIEEAEKRAEEERDWQEIFYSAEAAALGFVEAEGEVIDSNEETGESAEDLEKKLQDLVNSLGITATQLGEINARVGDANLLPFLEQLDSIKTTISDTSTEIDNLQSALNAAQNALDEYNESGYLTLDTFQDLMNVSALYLTSLVNENGQIEINQQTLNNLVETLKVAKIQELQNAEVQDILAYANGNVAEMSDLAQVAVASAGNAAQTAGQKASNGALGFWDLADALEAANNAAEGKKAIASNSGIQRIHNSYKQLANSLIDVKVNTTAAGNAAKSAGKKGAGAAKQAKDATKELNKELEETKKKYDTVIKWISKQYDKKTDSIKKAKDAATKAIEKEIKALEKEKDAILDNIEKETDALEKEKEARQKYWDDQIDALKKANQEKKDALELQEKLDALEKARNTKVKIYKEGQGFVYDVDQTAVAEAQKALDEYLSEKAYEDELARLEALKDAEMDNYEKRIDALNDYKDKVSKSYEEQIDALNAHKEALEEQYDAEIEMYEKYKQEFEDMVNAYQEQQDKLLFEQLTGIKAESDNWMTRLDNLAEFVRKYNELQKQLDTGNTAVSNDASMKSGGGGVGSGSPAKTATKSVNASSSKTSQGQGVIGSRDLSQSTFSQAGLEEARKRANLSMKSGGVITYSAHANGVGSIKDDELAIVGENPNQEIVIGSKLNNGELMSLNKGSGVVNADSSSTLAGMLNQVGKFGSSGFGSGNGTLNSNINNDTLTINGVTIQGADIKDPQTFVNGLLNLKAEALQRAYKHR